MGPGLRGARAERAHEDPPSHAARTLQPPCLAARDERVVARATCERSFTACRAVTTLTTALLPQGMQAGVPPDIASAGHAEGSNVPVTCSPFSMTTSNVPLTVDALTEVRVTVPSPVPSGGGSYDTLH